MPPNPHTISSCLQPSGSAPQVRIVHFSPTPQVLPSTKILIENRGCLSKENGEILAMLVCQISLLNGGVSTFSNFSENLEILIRLVPQLSHLNGCVSTFSNFFISKSGLKVAISTKTNFIPLTEPAQSTRIMHNPIRRGLNGVADYTLF